MASPQIENGFTKISNELLEALSMMQMSGSEWQYVMCLLRRTYGFNQKEAWVKNALVVLLTGMPKQRVSEAKLRLLSKNIVTEKRDIISLNKDYESWGLSRKSGLTVTEKRVKMTRKSVSIKETKKYIKERGDKSPSSMNLKDKQKASMSWNKPADDSDEFVVDYESGEMKSTAPVSKKKYPNALQVYKVFLEVQGKLPANWKVNKTQLQCAENLFEERGLDKVRSALQFYEEHKDQEFCPQISQPSDLDAKWTKLGEFKLKQHE